MSASQAEETMLQSSGIYAQVPAGGSSASVNNKLARRRRKRPSKVAGGESAGEGKKRRLSDEQVKFLEMNFGRERKLESGRKVHLAAELGLDPKQVAVWFQNRRARWKSKQLEEEYVRLRAMHDAVVVEKCHLEAEVLNLKEQLSEAHRAMTGWPSAAAPNPDVGERRSSSPSSSLSVELGARGYHQPPALVVEPGGFDVMYMQEYYVDDYDVNLMADWVNLYGMI